ncbi:MAG: FkbM family methyltransferase [Gammaproteobacteria bacterium]|nr:FkbM family methyltransferase [Gammaproteobacteria bacterium]
MANLALKFSARESCIHTNVGSKAQDRIVVENCHKGTALYGPYVSLGAGDYVATVYFDAEGSLTGDVLMDICASGAGRIVSAKFDLEEVAQRSRNVGLRFSLAQGVTALEIRLFCLKHVSATITAVELTRGEQLVGDVGSLLSSGLATLDLGSRLDRLELLCRGGSATYVGNNRVLAKVVIGSSVLAFLMPADDLLLMPDTVVRGVHEAGLTQYFAANISHGDQCVDIGANYGYYTCLMARLAHRGRTIGVEPNQPLFDLVRDNLYINSLQSAGRTLHAAVSNQSGRLTLYRRPVRSGNTSIAKVTDELVRKLGEPAQEAFTVDCLSIDDLQARLAGRIDVMKIDVEGAEPLAFRGAKQTIAANPQLRIVMEWAPAQIQGAGFEVREFVGELAALGLQAAIIHNGGLLRPIALTDLLGQRYQSGVLLTHR